MCFYHKKKADEWSPGDTDETGGKERREYEGTQGNVQYINQSTQQIYLQ